MEQYVADATSYADQLVALAERLSTAPKPPLLAMANRTDLATRVAAVLDSRQRRGRAGRFSMAVVCVASALLVATMSPLRVVTAAEASGASPTLAPQIVVVNGEGSSGRFELDPVRHTEIETMSLTFPAAAAKQGFTVDFITRYVLDRPAAAPGAVEVIITQHPANDAAHEMTMALDGRTVPLATQRQTRRSVATTIPVAQVQRLAQAGAIADQTFSIELRFSPEQQHALRETADRWLERLQP